MTSKFVPELYTLSRLIVAGSGYATTDEQPLTPIAFDDVAFANLDWDALGFRAPVKNNTWLAITYNGAAMRDLTQEPPEELRDPTVRRQLFLLAVADDLASLMASEFCLPVRAGYVKVHKPWNPSYAEELGYAPKPIYDNATLRKALVLIQESRAAARYLAPNGYGRNLMVKSAAETAPRNLVPLLTHTILAGKLYRAMEPYVEWSNNPMSATLDGVTVRSVAEAHTQWIGKLVMGIAMAPQQPREPDDLYVFEQLAECHRKLAAAYADNLLFAASNTFALFLPGDSLLDIREMLQPYTDRGFHVELDVYEKFLGDLGVWRDHATRLTLLKDLSKALEKRQSELAARLREVSTQIPAKEKPLRRLEQEIARITQKISALTSPPTREVYVARRDKMIADKEKTLEEKARLQQEQQSLKPQIEQLERELASLATAIKRARNAIKARAVDPSLFSLALYPPEISDMAVIPPPLCEVCQMRRGAADTKICPVCAEIRQHGLQLPMKMPWLLDGKTSLLWLRVQLDRRQLETWSAAQFARYVDELPNVSPRQLFQMKANPRLLPLLIDFTTDYANLLEDLELEILKLMGVRERLRVADDLWVLPLDGSNRTYHVLCRYLALLQQHFPALLSNTGSKKRKSASAAPLRLSLIIAPVSRPLPNSWADIYTPARDVTLHRVGEERLELNLARAQMLTGLDFANPSGQSFLQFLTELAEKPDGAEKVVAALKAQKGKWKPDTALGKILTVYNSRRVTVPELLDFYRICV